MACNKKSGSPSCGALGYDQYDRDLIQSGQKPPPWECTLAAGHVERGEKEHHAHGGSGCYYIWEDECPTLPKS